MFDPTAFENMRMVLEGQIYDKDLEGDLNILDRNDLFNSSKLAREYTISMSLKDQKNAKLTLVLTADVKNLASELLELPNSNSAMGATIKIQLNLRHINKQEIYISINRLLKELWGDGVKIVQEVRSNPLQSDKIIRNHIVIDFNRVVNEDQLEDLLTMVDYMEDTLRQLSTMDSLLHIEG